MAYERGWGNFAGALLVTLAVLGCGETVSQPPPPPTQDTSAADAARKAEEARQAEAALKAEATRKADLERKMLLVIEPFGGLAWEDTLLEVFEKLSKTQGVTKLALSMAGLSNVEVTGAKDQQIGDRIGTMLKTMVGNRKDEPQGKPFKGPEGDDLRHPIWDFTLQAASVNLKGVPFHVRVQFAYAPGIAVKKPDLMIQESAAGYALPTVVTKVVLQSKSSALAKVYQDLTRQLEAKYKGYVKYSASWGEDFLGTAVVEDGHGNSIEIRSGADAYTITYEGSEHLAKLDKVYETHVATLADKAGRATGKDLSGGL